MGNWNWPGILLMVGIFFALTAALLAVIQVDNPLAGYQTNVWAWLIDMIADAIF